MFTSHIAEIEGERPARSNGDALALVLFDGGRHRVPSSVPAALRASGAAWAVLGYPTLYPPLHVKSKWSAALGAALDPWPVVLSRESHAAVWVAASERARALEELVSVHPGRLPWARCKSNDRMYYRMLFPMLFERLLDEGLATGRFSTVVLPWGAPHFATLERPGILGFRAEAFELYELIRRVTSRHGVRVQTLQDVSASHERRALWAAPIAIGAVRAMVLLGRSVRDRGAWQGPAPAVRRGGVRPIGLLAGGASQVSSLRPLADKADPTRPVVWLSHDIFRSPTSRITLRAAGLPFVAVDGAQGPLTLARDLWQAACHARRARRSLERTVRHPVERAYLSADADALLELEPFAKALRVLIRREGLRAIVSANCVDAYLSTVTWVCRSEGIPHAVVQNAAMEPSAMPNYADADVFFAESAAFADVLRGFGARGRVEAVGLPYYDQLAGVVAHGMPAWRRERPALTGRQVIGVTTQTELFDFRPVLETLERIVRAEPRIALVVKLHPRENANAYADIGRRLQRDGLGDILHHIPADEFIGGCDALVSVASTTLMWALVAGVRPFSWIEPNLAKFAESLTYMQPEVTSQDYDADVVASHVLRHLQDPADRSAWRARREIFLAKHLTGADGQACERIGAIIDKLAAP
jgi:hypothetical protein